MKPRVILRVLAASFGVHMPLRFSGGNNFGRCDLCDKPCRSERCFKCQQRNGVKPDVPVTIAIDPEDKP